MTRLMRNEGKGSSLVGLKDAPLTGENVIIFSSDDWASGLKTSKYHIARHLARHNHVLFVNSVGLRAPTARGGDVKRALGKLLAFFKGPVRVPENLMVYTPIVFPLFRGAPVVKAFNRILLTLSMRWLKFRYGFSDPIVFAFTVAFNDAIGRLGEKSVVYYCVDDLRSFDGVDTAWFDREEDRLLSRADCVICCSEKLQEGFHQRGHRTHYVPHGVDWNAFHRAVSEDLERPADLQSIPEPRLGFFGLFTDDWIDFPLLRRMAADHPDWQIVLIGKLSSGLDVKALAPEPNVHYIGVKPFRELAAYSRHFSVGLVPFLVNSITHYCSPLKILEYLSAGLPVVSTDIPEARKYAGHVHVARNHDEFVALCEHALKEHGPEARQERSRAAQAYAWEGRIQTISQIVREAVAGRSA